ncbi:acylphosphatase [Kiloniella litopenaei]|uniref:acylphosphatase n=1 Tax=Kiloniella litopenaei TaxID=1549748 RepID=A0A0M2R4Q7_9PROT|nr:acylphosphatase [Kiloniella litopenaei]KKJ76832.1 acylphosphatase [Kiloniella litopenaei]
MADQQVRLLITGRVQGVWYRGWTVETATKLGLKGWVRNLMSGQVEAVAQGDESSIDALIKACHDGPQLASVESIDVTEDNSPLDDVDDFRQIK